MTSLVQHALEKQAREKRTDDGYGPRSVSGPFARQRQNTKSYGGSQYDRTLKQGFQMALTQKKIKPKKKDLSYLPESVRKFSREGRVNTPGSPGYWEK